MPHKLSWYKAGKRVYVNDKMQKTSYILSEDPGKNFDEKFNPMVTPAKMLKMGVFEGKYLNDCYNELPIEWYNDAKNRLSIVANPKLNAFGIKSRLSLGEWRRRKWIADDSQDVRGWFQWYYRYWLGRRSDEDKKQIARWRSFTRHNGQIVASINRMKPSERPITREQKRNHRPKQRQALLQWAYNPYI